jgi:cytochrome oxidase assembly protein ShyY1
LWKARSKLSSREPKAILKSFVALVLIILCLIAANWQYQRGVDRHAKNFKIESNTSLATINLDDIKDLKSNEWRTVRFTGQFDKSHEVLLRNRYNADGKYGYEYLTLFKSGNKQFWIDRGWVQAGESASDRPKTPSTPTNEIELTGRLRLDSSLPRGSFFALPASGNLISSWNLRSKVNTEPFYIDLIGGPGLAPDTPAELPELSDGPHMAYALQWLFFAGLIAYGRVLIRRR